MHQAFHTLFDLGKAAVVGEVGDGGLHARAFRVAAGDFDPRIVAQLLHAQADAVLLAVELEDLDLDLVAHVDHLGRMANALPGHVGDVQQAVHAAEVDERAVVGEVLDDALDALAFLQGASSCFALGAVLGFEHRTARNHHVVALLVELDDLEFQRPAFEMRGFAQRVEYPPASRAETRGCR